MGPTGPQGATGATGATGPAGSTNLPVQSICVDKKSTVYWGSCAEVDVKGTDYQIYARN
jgi:hypothetical protein